MNVSSVEGSLAKYRLLHFVIGVIVGTILLTIPKIIGMALCVLFMAILLPSAVPPEFTKNRWYDRFAVLAGAISVWFLFHFLHKL